MSTKNILPYVLNGIKPTYFSGAGLKAPKFVNYLKAAMYLDKNSLKAFGDVYVDLVDALAEKNLDYIEYSITTIISNYWGCM